MKAGLVRIASRSLLALAVVGLSACNDDPLDFNVKTATQLATNPSVMVLNGGGVQRLTVNTLNDGFEPTFDLPSLANDGSGCTAPVTGSVAVKELPAATAGGSAIGEPIDSVLATGAEPPSKYDITGVGLGETCLTASFASMSAEIPVTIVPFALIMTGPDTIRDGDLSTQTYIVEGINTDSTLNATWDVTSPLFAAVAESSDTLALLVTAVTSPNQISAVRGARVGGNVDLVVTTTQNGVERQGIKEIFVESPAPIIGAVTPSSGPPGTIVTIDGDLLTILDLNEDVPTIVRVNGQELANIISETQTQLTVQMPTYSAAGGPFTVEVEVNGVANTASGTWTQTVPFAPGDCSPGCDLFAGGSPVPISIPYDFAADFTGASTDQFYLMTVSRDLFAALDLSWVPVGNDVDLLVTDGGFTAFVCTDGGTLSNPEMSDCHMQNPGSYLLWYTHFGVTPINMMGSGAVSSFPAPE